MIDNGDVSRKGGMIQETRCNKIGTVFLFFIHTSASKLFIPIRPKFFVLARALKYTENYCSQTMSRWFENFRSDWYE